MIAPGFQKVFLTYRSEEFCRGLRPKLGDEMRPVDVIQRKVHPSGEETILRGTRNDQADVLRKIFLVVL